MEDFGENLYLAVDFKKLWQSWWINKGSFLRAKSEPSNVLPRVPIPPNVWPGAEYSTGRQVCVSSSAQGYQGQVQDHWCAGDGKGFFFLYFFYISNGDTPSHVDLLRLALGMLLWLSKIEMELYNVFRAIFLFNAHNHISIVNRNRGLIWKRYRVV